MRSIENRWFATAQQLDAKLELFVMYNQVVKHANIRHLYVY